jgi:hypothetical protein
MKAIAKKVLGAAVVLASCATVNGQMVLFNEPTPWITQRSDSLVIKAQVDTAQVKSKQVSIAVSTVIKGKESRIASKTFTVADLSKDFDLGLAKLTLLGGYDYMKIEWSVPKAKDKGDCVPVGIVDLSKLPAPIVFKAEKNMAAFDVKTFAALPSAGVQKTGDFEFATVWNEKNLGIIVKKNAAAGDKCLMFCADGKNGKNAFMSYPDRLIKYFPAKDSMATVHPERTFTNNTIAYAEKPWTSEGFKTGSDAVTIISVPLSDMGVLAMDGRMIGFAAFVLDKDGKQVAASPEKAIKEIPGTWANLVMEKQ